MKCHKKEEVDKILATSKSVSFSDLVQIKNVYGVVAAASFIAMSMQMTRIIKNNVYKDAEIHQWDKYYLNPDLLGGIGVLLTGVLSSQRVLKGRRILLITLNLLLLMIVNCIWLSFSSIREVQDRNYAEHGERFYRHKQLNWFDTVMYHIQVNMTYTIYYLIIVAGPIDICKNFMLQKN